MKIYVYLFILFFSVIGKKASAQFADHSVWNSLLIKNVTESGVVDYKAFIEDSVELNNYLSILEANIPDNKWSSNDVMAYWINAYNAYTIKLIVRNFPIKSIKEIGGKIPFVNSTWDIKFIKIGKGTLDLNNIEHTKLRKKYDDPRIHMALVCASRSCPILLNEAYYGDRLNEQLDQQSKKFLADNFRNKISANSAKISMIFKWYGTDFNKVGGVRSFINKYSDIKLSPNAKISNLDYDWGLNDK